jgi:hypothetical protein
MKSFRFLPVCLAAAAWSGCIVDERLGDRSDAAVDVPADLSADVAPLDDRSAPADVAPMPDAPAGDDVPTRDVGDVDAPPEPVDAAPTATVRAIDIGVVRGHAIPALMQPPSLGVVVTFRSGAIEPEVDLRELAREGGCVLRQPMSRAEVPARSVGSVVVTATPEGGATVALTPSPRVRGPWVIVEYRAELPGVANGTRVRVEVGATASSPAVTRDLVVTDTEYAPPTPVTDTPTARYLTWTRGSALEVAWRTIGAAPSVVGLTFNLFTPTSESYALSCTAAAGATRLTVPATVLMALYNLSPAMGVGGVSNILTASAPSTAMVGGVEVTTSAASFTVAGTRW